MDNIIENLYEMHIKKEEYPFGFPRKDTEVKEWALYNDLYEKLPQELRTMFIEYLQVTTERQAEEKKAVYKYGFQTAIQLVGEALKQ